jgi:DHA1 family bicyclomycin/chloramphenicol resistance-like MFS transporter
MQAEPIAASSEAGRAPGRPKPARHPPGGSTGAPAGRGANLSHAFAAAVLAFLMGLQPVTTDLMLPALPALAGDLNAPMAAVQLTMSALILAFGLTQLVWGPVADRIGRRPVLLLGLALYSAASVAAALGATIAAVVAARALQGAALAAVVVCGRAMVRDLYPPQEGGLVMARALTGLGAIAIASPLIGGALVAGLGWRAAVAAMAVVGVAGGLFVALKLPETLQHRRPDALQPGPLLRQVRATLAHPGFRAWALLTGCTYGGLFVFLAGSGVVLIGALGLAPATAGVVMSSCAISYIAGTLLARRWIPRLGLAGSVGRAAWLTLAASVALVWLAQQPDPSVLAVMAPVCLYALGHGVHMPCGQAGVVGPFPQAAGLASALAGFVTSALAFGIGLWLGRTLAPAAGAVAPFALGMAAAALSTVAVATTLVRRHGEPSRGA